MLLNALMFLATLLFQMNGTYLSTILGLFYPGSEAFEPYQIVTHMFMHGGFLHLAMNMFALVVFGAMLESVWGAKRFLFFYLSTGLGAVALHLGVMHFELAHAASAMDADLVKMVMEDGWDLLLSGKNYVDGDLAYFNLKVHTPTVGASGAVFGVLLAFGMMFPNKELRFLLLPISVKAKYFVGFYIVASLYAGVNNFADGIAHFAHLGGALFGFLILLYWKKTKGTYF